MNTNGSDGFDGIELADAIASLRDQLVEAAGRTAGQPVAFEVGDIQMEFALELRKEVKGGVKVKAWVVEAGTDAGASSARTHRVAFTLKPRDTTTGGSWVVGNEQQGGTAHFGTS
ncbi:trypco2 family protein [Streptomyces sp. NPDC050504]|uniref:trypco2 family protein n=1 Tax=Streptomyces sp. NPDC050504 TaxID=3365618 RepID=UPI0037A6D501